MLILLKINNLVKIFIVFSVYFLLFYQANHLYAKKYQGYYKIGNEYEIDNIKYTPKEYELYDAIGIASWYGKKFHKRKTANNEIFNMNKITAAHNTLPLPSIVKIINIANNKEIIAKVNDRGPFKKNRIIDLSKKAADRLGFIDDGTAIVRVVFLKKETENFLKKYNLQ